MTHSKAVIIVLFGGLCISFAALFVRLIDTADGFQILAYRGIGQFLVITLAACLIRRVTPAQFFTSVFTSLGGCGLWMGLAMGLSYCFYVFALLNTSVASTLFIQSSAPIFTALLSWIFLGEKPAKRTVIAICGAVLGVGIMVWSGADLGRGLGNFYAILAAFFFAVMLVISRGSGRSDVLGGNLLGAVFASIWMVGAALVFSKGGLAVSGYDFGHNVFNGVCHDWAGCGDVILGFAEIARRRGQRVSINRKLAIANVGMDFYRRGVKLVRNARRCGVIGKRGVVGVAGEIAGGGIV